MAGRQRIQGMRGDISMTQFVRRLCQHPGNVKRHIAMADDAFGALDAQTKLQLEDVLLSLWQRERRTVLFITHDLSEAVSMSDRVIVMSSRPGRIIADVPITLGRPRSVRALQKEAHYHELYSRVWSRLEEGLSQ
jgi:NitT/TauT family transport system ATP-binding protein